MTRRDLLSLLFSLSRLAFGRLLLARKAKPKSDPWFEVRTLKGVDFVLRNSPTPRKYLLETMPGGVALLDYNNEGLLDIFLVNVGQLRNIPGQPYSFNRRHPAYWNRLYRQNKDRSFTDVTELAGLADAGDANYGMGVAVGDYDNDGFPDIYVTNFGRNILYRNNGDGTLTDVTAKAGVAAGGWSVSAGFFDYDNDGLLDLFVTRYLDWSVENVRVNGQTRFATAAGSYLSSNDKRLHFGLGSAETADIQIKWPSGMLQVLQGVQAHQFIVIEESASP
jgi:hypothetical protein